MLFREKFLKGIESGTVTLAFRRWKRPSVKSGGSLLTPVGELQIESVEQVAQEQISSADARSAGYESRQMLLDELSRHSTGDIYRIRLGDLGPDPRTALRAALLEDPEEFQEVKGRLEKMDARSTFRAWTRQLLELLEAKPEVRAGDLCGSLNLELKPFKLQVRKLKALGLTESLKVGYRLSPRGLSYLRELRRLESRHS